MSKEQTWQEEMINFLPVSAQRFVVPQHLERQFPDGNTLCIRRPVSFAQTPWTVEKYETMKNMLRGGVFLNVHGQYAVDRIDAVTYVFPMNQENGAALDVMRIKKGPYPWSHIKQRARYGKLVSGDTK